MKNNSNTVVVYTAIFNDYDVLLDPKNPQEDIDYVCFTDQEMDSDVWEKRELDRDLSAHMKNRLVKIKPHEFFPDHEISVYIDGNLYLKGEVLELIDEYIIDDYLMAAPQHRERSCIYQEAEAVKKHDLDSKEVVNSQIDRYREKGFPEDSGLVENRLLIRKHNEPEIIDLMNQWWEELQKGSKRDQLSLMYLLWKNDIEVNMMEEIPKPSSNVIGKHSHKPDGWKGKFWEVWVPVQEKREEKQAYRIIFYPLKLVKLLITGNLAELRDGIKRKI